MKRDLVALANNHHDLLVIGGGIFGAGLARDAALRGLRVAVVDKGDFAGGTSSASSKLIHGGFRYLEQWEFGLVAESCRERHILRRIAPDRVTPLPLLLPGYRGDPRPLPYMRLGMMLYDALASYRNHARHRLLSAGQVAMGEPSMQREGLRGALRFYDCQEDDARLCIDNLVDAARHGALCANYCEITSFIRRGNRLVAAQAVDRLSGQLLEIQAKVFVNAAGPWVERVAQLASFEPAVKLSPSKGVHLLLPRLTRDHGIFFQFRRDGRMIFILPWLDCSLVGTTDTEFRGEADDCFADEADVQYLLDAARQVVPEGRLNRNDVITTIAGVRPLLRSDKDTPSARSRDCRIALQGDNLLSVGGGKYTTYRAIAQRIVDESFKLLKRRLVKCETAGRALPRSRPTTPGQRLADIPAVNESDIDHACTGEMAITVTDVMRRRTPLALSRHGGPEIAARVAEIMARSLKWDERQRQDSLADYVRYWQRSGLHIG